MWGHCLGRCPGFIVQALRDPAQGHGTGSQHRGKAYGISRCDADGMVTHVHGVPCTPCWTCPLTLTHGASMLGLSSSFHRWMLIAFTWRSTGAV